MPQPVLAVLVACTVCQIAAAVHTVTYLMLNGAINAFGHVNGSQPYPNTARNNQWLAWLTAGEGLHNNHHAARPEPKEAGDPVAAPAPPVAPVRRRGPAGGRRAPGAYPRESFSPPAGRRGRPQRDPRSSR